MQKLHYPLLACLVLLGCAGLPPNQTDQARKNRQQASETIRTFAEALSNDDPDAAMDQFSPLMSLEKRRQLSTDVRRATWLSFYTGYKLKATEAVKNRQLSTWLQDSVELSVPASNAQGSQFSQWLELHKTGEGWKLIDIALKKARRGADVDLPTPDRKQVQQRMSELLQKLKDGQYERAFLNLPEDTRLHARDTSWWQDLWGLSSGRRHIYEDLRRLEKLTVHRWPDPEKHLPTAYVATNSVMVIYSLPYSSPPLGITDDQLRIETLLSKKQDKWKAISLRLYGKAIPE